MQHRGAPFCVHNALQAVFPALERASSGNRILQRRAFHDYFVTHLPSSSLSPDKANPSHHKLPRSDSEPHQGPSHRSHHLPSASRETTVVRIPLRSAKHHFGQSASRGARPYNEDTSQAGTVEIPAFAKRQPTSVKIRTNNGDGTVGATSETGDPQVFYFGVFDGHGGSECSEFLRDRLHGYLEEASLLFGMESSLRSEQSSKGASAEGGVMGGQDADDLQKSLVSTWREMVGGYFKRFKPQYFPAVAEEKEKTTQNSSSIETVLTYAFLKADLDFTTAQASKHNEDSQAKQKQQSSNPSADDPVLSDRPLNDNDVLYHPDRPASQNLRTRPHSRGSSPDLNAPIGGSTRFKGGSTASIALISTPSPTPFWHPSTPGTLIAAHVGDTRILLCRTSDGAAVPLTMNHHPSAPTEARRLQRYAASFVTDSFGEERVLGLANTRAFGDIGSKRVGVSAEPQITRMELPPAGYAFIVLVTDGVSGHLEDQEIVDVVKESRTPAQAAEALTSFAVEVADDDADNATAVVVRLGGWERRSEGGGGSLGTKEQRDYRRQEALNPRSRRQ